MILMKLSGIYEFLDMCTELYLRSQMLPNKKRKITIPKRKKKHIEENRQNPRHFFKQTIEN